MRFNNAIPPSLLALCFVLLQVEYILKKDKETGTVTCLTEDVDQRELELLFTGLLVALFCLFWSENKDFVLLNLVSYFLYNLYYISGHKRPLYNPKLFITGKSIILKKIGQFSRLLSLLGMFS